MQGTTYSAVLQARGEEIAAMYAAAQLDAVAGIRTLASETAIDCDLTDAPAYTYATETAAADTAHEEFLAATAAGLPVQWQENTELAYPITGAVRLDGQYHVHPFALCRGLAAQLGSDRVVEDTTVLAVDEDSEQCTVTTARGSTINSGHVVIATQAPIIDPALLANRCTPMQSYCIAARIQGAVPSGMYLSCDDSTRSLRPARLADETVVVVGGEGHRVGDTAASSARWDTLAEWTNEHLGTATVTHRWATHDLVTTDRVPFIGQLSGRSQRRWVATGFGKWGMTNSYVAARLITSAIDGVTTPWAPAFDSSRIGASFNRNLLAIAASAPST